MGRTGSATRSNGTERLVDAHDVTRRFDGAGGVRNLTLRVARGGIVGLVGPSGSGKTTAVRLLLGIDQPETGRIAVLGEDPAAFGRDERRRIGYMPQHTALYAELTLRHNLQMMASLYGLAWRGRGIPGRRSATARQRVEDLLEMLDLQDVQGTRLRDASGGEQRRLALAAALVHQPELLVLDEPTTGIDPVLRRRLWEHFGALRDDGTTMLVTTQYVGEATHCDQIAILVEGRVMAVGTPGQLRRRAFGDGADEQTPFDDVFVRLVEAHRADNGHRGAGEGDGEEVA